MAEDQRRAIVIGGGFGGLAAAIRLQAAGVPTLLLERRDRPGGRAYVYRDNGFTFDAGPTVITAPTCLEELFHVSGRSMDDYVRLVPVTPFYRLLWDDGTAFDYSNDEAALVREIGRLSPRDVDGYRRFYGYARAVFREGYEKLASVPFLNIGSMIRVAPELLRLSAFRSVYSTVSRFIKDPHLRQAFSFHSLLVGGNPFAASSIYTLIHYLERRWGVFFPMGGTGALVEGLVRLFRELGGEIRLNADVAEIEVEGDRATGIRLASGERVSARAVVSNADVVHTYRSLLKSDGRARRKGERLARARHSMSLFLIYFGTKKKYPGIAHHTVLFGPRYKELLTDIFDRGVLAADFSLYLHAPTRTDPSLAPPDCEGFYVLAPVPHLGKGRIDWAVEGDRYADKILAYLERRCLPGLREHLVTRRIFTPVDFATELNAHLGSAFSLEPILRQSAYFRVQNRDARIGNLYFVGAGTHPGAGVPGVVNSAKATAGLVLADLGIAAPKEALVDLVGAG